MTAQGGVHVRFKRALATRNPLIATAAAHELPSLSLADALELVLLYRDTDRRRFERASVRWHALLCFEVPRIAAADALLAMAAIQGFADGVGAAAAEALAGLLAAYGEDDAARRVRQWIDQDRD